MDTLTFNTPILFRHLTFSEAKKQPILEVDLKKALEGLNMTMPQVLGVMSLVTMCSDDLFLQFIEMCLLLGCDYLEPIKGVGPKTAYKLMQEYGGLSKVLEHLRAKYVLGNQLPKLVGLTKGHRTAAKQDDDAEGGKKKRGGIQIPEEWPWEEAKKLFESPDVTPADQIEVSGFTPSG
jgi:flap endonuclease-1